jgi:hypothetical protein
MLKDSRWMQLSDKEDRLSWDERRQAKSKDWLEEEVFGGRLCLLIILRAPPEQTSDRSKSRGGYFLGALLSAPEKPSKCAKRNGQQES